MSSNPNSSSSSFKNAPIFNKFPLATSSPTKQKLNIMSEPVLAQFIQKHRTIVHHHFNSELENGLKARNLLQLMVDPKKDYDDNDDDLVSLKSKLDVDDEGISIIEESSPEQSELQASSPNSSTNSTLSVKDLEFTDDKLTEELVKNLDTSQHSSETLTVPEDLHTKEGSTKELKISSDNKPQTNIDKVTCNLEQDSNSITTDKLNSMNQPQLSTLKPSNTFSEDFDKTNLQQQQLPQSINNENEGDKLNQIEYNLNSQANNQLINGITISTPILNFTDIIPFEVNILEKKTSNQSNIQNNNNNEALDNSNLEDYDSLNRVDREQTTISTNNTQSTHSLSKVQFNNNSLHLDFKSAENNNEASSSSGEFDNKKQVKVPAEDEPKHYEDHSLGEESDIEDLNDDTITSIQSSELDDNNDLKTVTRSNSSSSLNLTNSNNNKFNNDMNTIYSRLRSRSNSPKLSTSSDTLSIHDETLNNDTEDEVLDKLSSNELKYLVKDLIKSNERLNSWYNGISSYIPKVEQSKFHRLKNFQSSKLSIISNLINKGSSYYNTTKPSKSSSNLFEKEVNVSEFIENYRDHSSRVQLSKYLAQANSGGGRRY